MSRTILATATAFDAAMILREQGATALAVTSHDGSLAGLVSEQDLMKRLLLKNLNRKTTLVSAIMTKDVQFATIREVNTDILSVQARMMKLGVKHIPVVRKLGVDGKHAVVDCLDIRNVVRLVRRQQAEASGDSNGPSQWGTIGTSFMSSISNIGALFGLQAAKSAAAESGVSQSDSKAADDYHTSSGALVLPSNSSIRSCAAAMAKRRCTAVVLHEPTDSCLICGIITAHDIVKKVIAADREVDLNEPAHASVMTWDPLLLREEDAAVDCALDAMNKNGFRHLPVVKVLPTSAVHMPTNAASLAPSTPMRHNRAASTPGDALFSPLKHNPLAQSDVTPRSAAAPESKSRSIDFAASQRVRVMFVYDYVTALQVMLGLPAVTHISEVDEAVEEAEDQAARDLEQGGAALLLSPQKGVRSASAGTSEMDMQAEGSKTDGYVGGPNFHTAAVAVVSSSVVLRLKRVCQSMHEAKQLVSSDRFGESVEKLRRPLLRLDMLCKASEREHGEHNSIESAILFAACLSLRVQAHTLQGALSAVTGGGGSGGSQVVAELSHTAQDLSLLDSLCGGTYGLSNDDALKIGAGSIERVSSLRPGMLLQITPDISEGTVDDTASEDPLQLCLPPFNVIPSCFESLAQQQTAAGLYSDSVTTVLRVVDWHASMLEHSTSAEVDGNGQGDRALAIAKAKGVIGAELNRIVCAGLERVDFCRDVLLPSVESANLNMNICAAADPLMLSEAKCQQVDEMLMGVNAVCIAMQQLSHHRLGRSDVVLQSLAAAIGEGTKEADYRHASLGPAMLLNVALHPSEVAGLQAIVVGAGARRASIAAQQNSSKLLKQKAASLARMHASALDRCSRAARELVGFSGQGLAQEHATHAGALAGLLALAWDHASKGRFVRAATVAGLGCGLLTGQCISDSDPSAVSARISSLETCLSDRQDDGEAVTATAASGRGEEVKERKIDATRTRPSAANGLSRTAQLRQRWGLAVERGMLRVLEDRGSLRAELQPGSIAASHLSAADRQAGHGHATEQQVGTNASDGLRKGHALSMATTGRTSAVPSSLDPHDEPSGAQMQELDDIMALMSGAGSKQDKVQPTKIEASTYAGTSTVGL